MKLSIDNIGKIGSATIEIEGITVIAGENDTGKSTVGRALYAVFNSFYKHRERIEAEREQTVGRLIYNLYCRKGRRPEFGSLARETAQDIILHMDEYQEDMPGMTGMILEPMARLGFDVEKEREEDYFESHITRVHDTLQISDAEVFKSMINHKLAEEFHSQATNIFLGGTGEIALSFRGTDIAVTIEDNQVKTVSGDVELGTEAVYIDDPFVLDEAYSDYYFPLVDSDHQEHLRAKLRQKNSGNFIDAIMAGNKLAGIYEKIDQVCAGDLIRDGQSSGYRCKGSDKLLEVKNLSTGLKTFAILKTLLLNGSIDYNGTVILDEPEIHLHPEWQLLFAELIVLLQREFGLHVLLNTHSPYFLNAIEVYAAKHGVDDKCRYYLASVRESISSIEDVTNNIEAIYSKLARPLQRLENERGRL